MANYNNLKAGIDAAIKTNGRQEISGAALNAQLKNMITELGAGYQYMGVAAPATNPGTPDANVFYLASEAGTYTNFGGIVINEGEVCALVWNGTWAKEVTGIASADQLNQLGQQVIYDVTMNNAGSPTFASLSALLSDANIDTLIPTAVRAGGMSIRFVQTSDNKYVQFRYMSSSTAVADFTNVANWQGVDDEPTAGSQNLVKSGGVADSINIINKRTSGIIQTEEKQFSVTDEDGNVVFKITLDGKTDILSAGSNLVSTITNLVNSNSILLGLISSLNELVDNPLNSKKMLNIVDSEDNILWSIHPIVVEEEGIYFIDDNSNVGASIIDGKFKFAEDKDFNEDDYISVINRVNGSVKEIREIKNSIDNSVPSLLAIEKSSEHTTKTVSFTSIGAVEKRMVKVGLHYGASQGTPNSNELFFNGDCDKDFGDIRFFDSEGNILKAQFGECVNMEPIFDTKLNDVRLVLSDGTLVGYNNGIKLSTDGGTTWNTIAGTTTPGQQSDVDHHTYMYPFFVDSNDNIYAYLAGILYKLHSSDNYATISQVLDFSWDNNGTTIYPDIKDGAAEDLNGKIYIGPYQTAFHTSVFVSADGGDTFSLSWASWDAAHSDEYGNYAQHVHHIHANPYNTDVYVGIDDGSLTWNGPIILKTSNGGLSWTDITKENHGVRGRDYYPTYFGDGTYKLGGGETYVLGGSAIIRSKNDLDYELAMMGPGGVRSYSDFGNDSLIVAGIQTNELTSANQLVYSKDKGKTWHTFFYQDKYPYNASGMGFRKCLPYQTLMGDSEGCILFLKDSPNLEAMKLYKGGNHYYREAYIFLENVADEAVTITVKTGYMMPYPYDDLNGVSIKPVYSIPCNEGFGRYVHDSEGNVARINGDYSWDKVEPVRRSEYNGNDSNKPFSFSSGLKVNKKLNFGKIPALSFYKNYTITFWMNCKSRELFNVPNNRFSDSFSNTTTYKLFELSNMSLYVHRNRIGLMSAESNVAEGTTKIAVVDTVPSLAYMFSDNYFFIAIIVTNTEVHLSVNGNVIFTQQTVVGDLFNNAPLISNRDLCIGSDTNEMGCYISDVNFYNEELTEKQINALYKGYYNY